MSNNAITSTKCKLFLVDRKYALRNLLALARSRKQACQISLLQIELRGIEQELAS